MDVHTADLAFASALAEGKPEALDCFEATLMQDVSQMLRRRGITGTLLDDARQDLRAKLFAGAPPAIREYTGRGSLRSWVLVVAMRDAIKLAQRNHREYPVDDDELASIVAPVGARVLESFRSTCRDQFRRAFATGVAALSPRERTVLRLALLHRSSIDDLAAIYGVHRATAARWIQAAKLALRTATHAALAEQLGTDEREVDSLVRLVESQLDVSSERLLAS
jgi:RNA polymerase sigma-70 factor, ECF subfamily